MPTVAIVGRPNVGKSALFNRLAGRKIAIVHDQPGVTRDRIAAPSKATAHACTLVDTGGIGAIIDDGFGEQVAIEADIAMETADLILFVVDAQDGLTPVDQALAQKLRKAKPPVLLAINKVDDLKHEGMFSEFARLGFTTSILVSAEHGRNFGRLCDEIDAVIAPLVAANAAVAEVAEAVGIKLAIVGKPNAGKSSLVNAILRDERTIVSAIAGTTRDRVQETIQIEGVPIHVIDTAGLRDSVDQVEKIGIARAWEAIAAADVVLFLHDLTRINQADYRAGDAEIAATLLQKLPSGVPVMDIWNKADAADASSDKGITLSAKTGLGLDALRHALLQAAGWQAPAGGSLMARERHIQALRRVENHCQMAAQHLASQAQALDLLAEELRLAQGALSDITGEFSSDDLLGVIFSQFCIGK